jgi:hypothetical protein
LKGKSACGGVGIKLLMIKGRGANFAAKRFIYKEIGRSYYAKNRHMRLAAIKTGMVEGV